MSWVDAIVQNLLAILRFLSPVRVVRVYQRGVVFRFGIVVRTVAPGLRFLWPCKVEEMELVQVAEETRNLLSQTVTTADDISVTFSVNLVFRVIDPALYLCAVFNFDDSLDAFAMTHLAARAREQTWGELREGQKKLEASLKGTLTTRLDKWGAEIVSVGFTDMTKAQPFRLFGDPGALARAAAVQAA
jgi:regulator of protease activity HflC (stomatin/prohibitin superfamily)